MTPGREIEPVNTDATPPIIQKPIKKETLVNEVICRVPRENRTRLHRKRGNILPFRRKNP